MQSTIVIRTYNEERWIGACIDKIRKQKKVGKFEIIVVDSQSTDRTIEIVKEKKNIKLIKLNKNEFTYGKALNLGCFSARGNYIVFISAHCIPMDNYWLYHMLKSFSKNVAGVSGYQGPHPEVTLFQKRRMDALKGLPRKIYTCPPSIFSNSNSAIRKEIWMKYKFDEFASFREDKLWADKVLNEKYHIVYEPKAKVYHFHEFNILEWFKRGIDIGQAPTTKKDKYLYLQFIYTFFKSTLDDILYPGKLLEKIYWFFVAPIYNLMFLIGNIIGYGKRIK